MSLCDPRQVPSHLQPLCSYLQRGENTSTHFWVSGKTLPTQVTAQHPSRWVLSTGTLQKSSVAQNVSKTGPTLSLIHSFPRLSVAQAEALALTCRGENDGQAVHVSRRAGGTAVRDR